MTTWAKTTQRNDLKTCPFCDTPPIEQIKLADSDTNMNYRIACGNPHCFVDVATPVFAALPNAEWAWQDRAP